MSTQLLRLKSVVTFMQGVEIGTRVHSQYRTGMICSHPFLTTCRTSGSGYQLSYLLAKVLSRSAIKSSSSFVSPSFAGEKSTRLISTSKTLISDIY